MAKKKDMTVQSEVENRQALVKGLQEHFAKELKRLDADKDAETIEQINFTLEQLKAEAGE